MTTATLEAPETRTRRRRDPEATRQAILDAAEKLFVELGPNVTSTSEIGKAAGVTKSLIHHHFGSKEDLWLAVRQRHFERYYDAQKQMLQNVEGTSDLLRDSIVSFFHYLRDDPNAVRFMSWRTIENEDPCLDLEHELFALGVDRIREAQEAGTIRDDVEPLAIIKIFLGIGLHWYQTKSFLCEVCGTHPGLDPDVLTDERFLEDTLKVLFEGIRPR